MFPLQIIEPFSVLSLYIFFIPYLNVELNYSILSLAKRRMMGICKCKQLITAGARQMHIFYHMAKDRQVRNVNHIATEQNKLI